MGTAAQTDFFLNWSWAIKNNYGIIFVIKFLTVKFWNLHVYMK